MAQELLLFSLSEDGRPVDKLTGIFRHIDRKTSCNLSNRIASKKVPVRKLKKNGD